MNKTKNKKKKTRTSHAGHWNQDTPPLECVKLPGTVIDSQLGTEADGF